MNTGITASSICCCNSCNTWLQNVQCSYRLQFSVLHLLLLLLQIARIILKYKYYSLSGGVLCLYHQSMMLSCCKWTSSCFFALSAILKIYSSPLIVLYRLPLHGQSVINIQWKCLLLLCLLFGPCVSGNVVVAFTATFWNWSMKGTCKVTTAHKIWKWEMEIFSSFWKCPDLWGPFHCIVISIDGT